MEYFYVSVIFVSSILEELLFYHILFRGGMVISWKNIVPLFIPYALLVGLTYREAGILFMAVVVICADFYAGCSFFKIGIIENLKYWIGSVLLIILLEQAFMGVFMELFSYTPSFSVYGIESMFACLVVLVAAFFVDQLLRGREWEKGLLLSKTYVILIPLVAGIVICLSYMVYLVSGLQPGVQKKTGFFLFFLAVAALCVAVLIVLYLYRKKEYFEMKSDLEGRYARQQRGYFLLLLEKEEETKRFRHDMMEHFLCIQDAMKNEDFQAVDTYISDILSNLDTISHSQYDMGDEVMNVILNYYLVPIQKNCDIVVEGYVGKLETVSQMDRCIIFSNAIKNAAEAAGGKGRIRILGNRGRDFVRIVVGNTYSGNIRQGKDGMPETVKFDRENHGFGVENMRRAVQKNQGQCDIHISDGWFEVELILPDKKL